MKPLRNHSNALALLVALVAIAAALAVGVTAAHATSDPSDVSVSRCDDEDTPETVNQFCVLFSDEVTNVDLDDFVVEQAGGGDVTGELASVAPIDSSAAEYLVTVDEISGDGALTVVLSNDSDITFVGGDPITVDHRSPQVDSLEETSFEDGTIHFAVHFDEDVHNVNAGSFDIDSTGSLDWEDESVSYGDTNSDVDFTIEGVTGSGTFTVSLERLCNHRRCRQPGRPRQRRAQRHLHRARHDGPGVRRRLLVERRRRRQPHLCRRDPRHHGLLGRAGRHHRSPADPAPASARATSTRGTRDLGYDATYAVFSYTVQPGDFADGITIGELDLNGGTIRDAAHNDATGGDGGTRRFPLVSINGIARPAVVDSTPVDVAPAPAPAPGSAGAARRHDAAREGRQDRRRDDEQRQARDRLRRSDRRGRRCRDHRQRQGRQHDCRWSVTVPATLIAKPGKLVVQLVAVDAAGNPSDPVTVTLTRAAAPAHPADDPGLGLAARPLAERAGRDSRCAARDAGAPSPPGTPSGGAWHRQPVTATVG